MAKSLRSKSKRRMRAVKRVKNAPRELARLHKALKMGKDGEVEDAEMKELVTVTDLAKAKSSPQKGDTMEVDGSGFNRKTKKDENGQYLPWMNQRAMRKMKAKNAKGKKIKQKRENLRTKKW